ncbi:MAG: STAS domain-containing protein [Pseudomonadota bacterium]
MARKRAKLIIDRLPPRVTADALEALLAALKEGPHRLKVEAKQVETIEPGGIEALLVLSKTQRARGDAFEIANASEGFLADTALFGVPPAYLEGKSQ